MRTPLRLGAATALAALGLAALAPTSATAAATSAAPRTLTLHRAPSLLAGSRTGVDHVQDVDTDSAGRMYVLATRSVRVFAAGAHGNVAPKRTVSLGLPAGDVAQRIAVDRSGWMYVLFHAPDYSTIGLSVFAPGAKTAEATFSDQDLGLDLPLDLTAVGTDVAFIDIDSRVRVYDLRSGDLTPVRSIESTSTTKVDNPGTIEADPAGRLVLAGRDWVSVFAPGASTDADPDLAPQRYLAGSRTGLGDGDRSTGGVGLDRRGRIVVSTSEVHANPDDTSTTVSDARLLAFRAGANGNVAPEVALTGSRAGLGDLAGVEVAPSGAVLTNRYSSATSQYAAALAVHRPLGPYAAPGAPRSLRVSGTSAARRTVSWQPARTSADTPVTGYVVDLTCTHPRGSSHVSRRVAASRHTLVLPTGGPGSCRVRVVAANVYGTGAPATRGFRVR